MRNSGYGPRMTTTEAVRQLTAVGYQTEEDTRHLHLRSSGGRYLARLRTDADTVSANKVATWLRKA